MPTRHGREVPGRPPVLVPALVLVRSHIWPGLISQRLVCLVSPGHFITSKLKKTKVGEWADCILTVQWSINKWKMIGDARAPRPATPRLNLLIAPNRSNSRRRWW